MENTTTTTDSEHTYHGLPGLPILTNRVDAEQLRAMAINMLNAKDAERKLN